MKDVMVVQRLEAADRLHQHSPDLFLCEVCALLNVFADFRVEVASARVFHDYAQSTAAVVEEGLLIRDDVGMSEQPLYRSDLLE